MIYSEQQKALCNKYNLEYLESPDDLKIGISDSALDGIQPLNGLRHAPKEGTTGWFIYGGEYSDDPNFFKPLCVKHLYDKCPSIIKYLGLPVGWRFLVDDSGYEDVWFDKIVRDT